MNRVNGTVGRANGPSAPSLRHSPVLPVLQFIPRNAGFALQFRERYRAIKTVLEDPELMVPFDMTLRPGPFIRSRPAAFASQYDRDEANA